MRPVRITISDEPGFDVFLKNMSKHGTGIVTNRILNEGAIAVLTIHCTQGHPVHIKSALRWSDPYGQGWCLTG